MNMKKNRLLYTLIVIIGMMPGVSGAALKFVRAGATGTNDGSDWNNAYPALPTSLVRGNTYYLADGSYSDYTFDDANNGTTVITIKKAIVNDHGTDTGWVSTYGDGQASFGNWTVITDYYVFDGQVRNANWRTGAVSQYGIKVMGGGMNGKAIRLDDGAGTGGDNLSFRYIDAVGGGRDTGNGDDIFYGLTGNSNITIQYSSLRDCDRVMFTMRGKWTNLLVDNSYMARNQSNDVSHGELLSAVESDSVTFSNNVIEDIEGTAIWAFLNGPSNNINSNWKIFGNTIAITDAYIAMNRYPTHTGGITGIVFCGYDGNTNNNICNNFSYYNNTAVNIQGLWSGIVITNGTGNVAQNNIWYNSVRTNNTNVTASYNLYTNTIADGDTSASRVDCTANCNIFINPANMDFHLNTATANGTVLVAPYNTDPDGITRGSDGTWDRGAFEFGGAQSGTILPPTLNTITQ
jgi:hypothetical protein